MPHGESEDETVKRYIPLVRSIVAQTDLKGFPHLDSDELYSIGLLALLGAVRKFDPNEGSSFMSFACQRIRWAVCDAMRRADTLSRKARMYARMIAAAKSGVEQRLGRPAKQSEIRRELNLDEKTYSKWLARSITPTFLSLDKPVLHGDGEGPLFHEIIPDEQDILGHEMLSTQELSSVISESLKKLPGVHRVVIQMLYFEGLAVKDIARRIGITHQAVAQRRDRALLRLRNRFYRRKFIYD